MSDFSAKKQFEDACIVQFAKAPQRGKVKTRMQPVLSEAQCVRLHEQLLSTTTQVLVNSQLAQVELSVTHHHAFFDDVYSSHSGDLTLSLQVDGNLGEKMQATVAKALQKFQCVIVVGSDCPFIDKNYLLQAFEALQHGNDIVLGPAKDGGYVLIGLTSEQPTVFADVDWGTEKVLAQTLRSIDRLKLRCHQLESLHDIDRPEDLSLLDASYSF